MIRRLFLGAIWLIVAMPMNGQNAGNPFELRHRLPKESVAGSVAAAVAVNPFDVVPHRIPGVSKGLNESNAAPFRPFSILPRGGGLSTSTLFWVLVGMFSFLTFAIAFKRGIVFKAWRGFLNDNALVLAQREASGLVGSTPYYLLYGSFVLNAGMFIFLVIHYFKKDLYNNFPFLLLCFAAATGIFLFKHFMLNLVGWVFNVRNETKRYNFLIIIFNCVLGLFLVPFNLLLTFSTELKDLLVFWTLGLAAIFYVYRGLRSAPIGLKILATDQFHFFLYLCTVEIAPVLLLLKLVLNQSD
ncbi:MAG: DUF4271 domain-containing protein [Saprospiraceae bacterium]